MSDRSIGDNPAILILGIGGNLGLANGMFPFKIPVLFPDGIPAIVFAAILGILVNAGLTFFSNPGLRKTFRNFSIWKTNRCSFVQIIQDLAEQPVAVNGYRFEIALLE